MLQNFKYKREEIIELLKKESEKTQEGYYWFPKFIEMNMDENGLNDDDKYFYDRDLFKYKMYFNDKEIEAYLSEKVCFINIDDMQKKSFLFYETNYELKEHKLKNKVKNYLFNIEELIECFEYLHN